MKIVLQYRSSSLVRFLSLSTIILLLFIAQALMVSAAPANLILNPSLETASSDPTLPQDWIKGGWGTNTRVFTYPAIGYEGAKAAKVEITSYTNGDAKWYFKEVPVTSGQTYTFTNNYISSVPSFIIARFKVTNGTFTYFDLPQVGASPTSWKSLQGNVTVPANVTSMTVFHVIKQVGYLTTDNFSLVSASTTPPPPPPPPPTDTTIPSASITSPGAGATLSGNTTVAVSASDNIAVAGVTLLVDGSVLGTEDTVAPYEFTWNTASSTNASHTLTARARDTSGNIGTSSLVSVTVSNVAPPPPPSPTSTNLIANPSFETPGTGGDPTNWFRGGWGNNTRTHTIVDYPPRSGSPSSCNTYIDPDNEKTAKVTITNYVDGDAKWYFADVPIGVQKTFTMSHWYRSGPTNTQLIVRYLLTNGTYSYVKIADLGFTVGNGGCQGADFGRTASHTFTAPSNAVSMTLYQKLINNGFVEVDKFSLTNKDGTTPPPPTNSFTEGMVTFSFDDAWLTQYTNALPILQKAGIKGTFYITSGRVVDNVVGYMNPNNVIDIAQKGHEIGGHTVTHPDLTTLSTIKIDTEIKTSKTYLQNLTGTAVTTLAYPFGAFNVTVEDRTKKAGYTNARNAGTTIANGFNTMQQNILEINSFSPTSAVSLAHMKAAIDRAKTNKEWFVFSFHRVENGSGDYLTTIADLQALVDYVKNTGIKTVTIKEGAALLR